MKTYTGVSNFDIGEKIKIIKLDPEDSFQWDKANIEGKIFTYEGDGYFKKLGDEDKAGFYFLSGFTYRPVTGLSILTRNIAIPKIWTV